MKKFLCFFILVNLVFMLSCNGGGYCNVEGNVYEERSNIPIHNVYVRINDASSSPFREATTDENGHYKIRYFKYSGKNNISIDIISGEHVSILNKPVNSKNANISAYLTPYGYVRFRVKNNTPNNLVVYGYVETQKKYVPTISSIANSDQIYSDATAYVITNKKCKLQWSYALSSNPYTYLGTYSDSVIVTNKWDTLTYMIQIN